jgi:hypothetical protein
MVQPSRKGPGFDLCCSTAENMARDVVFSINVGHVGFVMDSVALGQVSFTLSVSFCCGIRTVK